MLISYIYICTHYNNKYPAILIYFIYIQSYRIGNQRKLINLIYKSNEGAGWRGVQSQPAQGWHQPWRILNQGGSFKQSDSPQPWGITISQACQARLHRAQPFTFHSLSCFIYQFANVFCVSFAGVFGHTLRLHSLSLAKRLGLDDDSSCYPGYRMHAATVSVPQNRVHLHRTVRSTFALSNLQSFPSRSPPLSFRSGSPSAMHRLPPQRVTTGNHGYHLRKKKSTEENTVSRVTRGQAHTHRSEGQRNTYRHIVCVWVFGCLIHRFVRESGVSPV